MLTNQRGSTLLTVLIINLVLIILGMSIISATIGSAKRTAMRDTEISITYGAMDTVNAFTTKLAQNLNKFPISSYFSNYNTNVYESNLEKVLKDTIEELLDKNNNTINKNIINCINLIDITGDSPDYVFRNTGNPILGACLKSDLKTHKDYQNAGLNLEDNLTRVYDLVITTTNPIKSQGNVEKLVTKRLILSPLPSFLRYAVGSESLSLNGSSNIVGNVFANNLELKNKAKYSTNTSSNLVTSDNQFPSIVGNIYSTSAEVLGELKKGNFYKTVPNLFHDSQFANINFDQTFLNTIKKTFIDLEYKNLDYLDLSKMFSSYKSELKKNITTGKNITKQDNFDITACTKEDENGKPQIIDNCWITVPDPQNIKGDISVIGDLTLGDIGNKLEVKGNIYVEGDLIIYAKEELNINGNIYVSGNLAIISDAPLTIGFKDSINHIKVNGDVSLVSSNSIEINNTIESTGTISISNFNANLKINKTIVSGEKIVINSILQGTQFEGITSINGDIISNDDTLITTKNMKTEISKNIYINGNFTISGDQETDNEKEKDNVFFNSVLYVNGVTTISNTNIFTLDVTDTSTMELKNGNLVLLSKGNLLLTRINEFRYYDEESDKRTNYLPLDSEQIKPIKGFFYTDSNAELYGVGSLFYVHGGIFARNNLEINAVRGKTSNGNFSPSESQDKLSRFIVKYDDSILFNSLTSLPIVDHLQLIMDEQTVQ